MKQYDLFDIEELPNNITFHANGISPTPILSISEDGFYVRGKKVPVDDNEALAVYKAFKQWMVTEEMMRAANPQALFMHCLPAHRGEEVAASVIDGPQSVVWDEAENRLHAQKALMEFLLKDKIKLPA